MSDRDDNPDVLSPKRCSHIILLDALPEILDKMAAALAHIVNNGVQMIQETVWKFVTFLKYNNQELLVPSALDRGIFSTDSAIH